MLDSKQAVDIAHGQALVDEFGDYEAVYQEIIRLKREVDKGDMIIGKLLNEGKAATEKNTQLRQLLKECKEYLSDVDTYFTYIADEATLLLTRIKEVLIFLWINNNIKLLAGIAIKWNLLFMLKPKHTSRLGKHKLKPKMRVGMMLRLRS